MPAATNKRFSLGGVDSRLVSVLDPFVPAFARRWIAEESWTFDEPTLRRGRGVVLAADLVGFTALTDRFARESAEGGAEAVQAALNSCFGTLVNVIGRYDGEVLAFAGVPAGQT